MNKETINTKTPREQDLFSETEKNTNVKGLSY